MGKKTATGLWLALLLVFALAVMVGCEKEESCATCSADDDVDDDTVSPDNCQACHTAQATAWKNASSHRSLYDCAYCHEQVLDQPGPGHHAKPGCDDCHSEATHIPTYYPDGEFRLIACTTCHEPHGSTNIYLIQPKVLVEPGAEAAISFQNLAGLAADSYAIPAPDAGTGLCEVCHVGTTFYNRGGQGEAHFTGRCTQCHDHARGFMPPS
jgi:hypothetical protein